MLSILFIDMFLIQLISLLVHQPIKHKILLCLNWTGNVEHYNYCCHHYYIVDVVKVFMVLLWAKKQLYL